MHISRPPTPVEIDNNCPNLPQEVRDIVKSKSVLRIRFYYGSGKTGSKFKIDLETEDKEWNSFIMLETQRVIVLPRSKSLN